MIKTTRVFGVEIELNCTLMTEGRKVYPNIDHYDLSWGERDQIHHGGPHPRGEFKLLPGWKYHYDGTCGAEIVSPPIHDTSSVEEMCKRIKESGIAYTFVETGLHVHVQAIDFEDEDVLQVARFCRHFDRTIFSFMDKGRIKSTYCQPMARSDKALLTEIKADCALTDRYRGCNLHAFYKHGTIEFRYAEGTDDALRIEALVELYTCIMDWCKKNKGNVRSPKKQDLKREFLLNLIGVRCNTYNNLMKPR